MNYNFKKIISETKDETVKNLAEHIHSSIKKKEGLFTMALSGGSTPAALFEHLSEQYKDTIPWDRVKIFWVDERCVPPDHKDSNYGMTRRTLLDRIEIPEENIYRVQGENNPDLEAQRYSELISKELDSEKGLPVFDLILLGMGDDGHTASIFPDQMDLLKAESHCVTAMHPENKLKRISLSGPTINNGREILFLICGSGKRTVLEKVLKGDKKYPASHINPEKGELYFYLDRSAAG